jgi:hypothetical protein
MDGRALLLQGKGYAPATSFIELKMVQRTGSCQGLIDIVD